MYRVYFQLTGVYRSWRPNPWLYSLRYWFTPHYLDIDLFPRICLSWCIASQTWVSNCLISSCFVNWLKQSIIWRHLCVRFGLMSKISVPCRKLGFTNIRLKMEIKIVFGSNLIMSRIKTVFMEHRHQPATLWHVTNLRAINAVAFVRIVMFLDPS